MMDSNITQLADMDNLFYYGKGDLDAESRSDLMQLLVQPKGSMFYNRKEAAGVEQYENYPNAIMLQVMLRFEIAKAVAYRNQNVTDGSDGTLDRRIAVSQGSISFNQNGGDMDINVMYFLYADQKIPRNLSVPVGRS